MKLKESLPSKGNPVKLDDMDEVGVEEVDESPSSVCSERTGGRIVSLGAGNVFEGKCAGGDCCSSVSAESAGEDKLS